MGGKAQNEKRASEKMFFLASFNFSPSQFVILIGRLLFWAKSGLHLFHLIFFVESFDGRIWITRTRHENQNEKEINLSKEDRNTPFVLKETKKCSNSTIALKKIII